VPGDWEEIERIYDQLRDSRPEDRSLILDRECGANPETRAELESLLAMTGPAGTFLESPGATVHELLRALESEFLVGKTLGGFRIESHIGDGGMGVVYRGIDTATGDTVAVKVLPPDRVEDGELRSRFSREARAAARLDHPNVAKVHGLHEEKGFLFLVMEFVEGHTLRQALARAGTLPQDQALEYFQQIVSGLEAAHAAGVVHHDIKPSNIMVCPDGRLKLLDFGLCSLADDPSSTHPVASAAPADGTTSYLSPEQARGTTGDHRTDIFAAGVVFYEMLTGRPPFRRESKEATIEALLHDAVPPLPAHVAKPISRSIERCLRKDPEARFSSARKLRDAVEAARRDLAQSRMRRALRWAVPLTALAIVVSLAYVLTRHPAPQQVTFHSGASIDPALSPDGKWLAYASNRAGDTGLDIWLQSTAGGPPRRITSDPLDESQPGISPDGRFIAYRSERDGGIRVIPAGGGPSRLIAKAGLNPRFSPDGRKLLYWLGTATSGDPFAAGRSEIYVTDLTSGSTQRLAADFAAARNPVWSPDGSTVLFAGNREPTQIWNKYGWWTHHLDGQIRKVHHPIEDPGLPLAWINRDSVWALRPRTSTSAASVMQVSLNGHGGEVRMPGIGDGEILVGASVASDGSRAFAKANGSAGIWFLPVDSSRGELTGPLRRAVESKVETSNPLLSTDGEWFFYRESPGFSEARMVRLNLKTGRRETRVDRSRMAPLAVTGDGRRLVYSAPSAGGDFGPEVRVLVHGSNVPAYSFWWKGIVWDVTPNGEEILRYAADRQPRAIEWVRMATGQSSVILQNPEWNLYLASLSADGGWVAFEGNRKSEQRLFIAPFRGSLAVPPQEWIEVDGGGCPRWSPDGGRIYFIRSCQGHRCVYMRTLEAHTKRPVGDSTALYHFHDPSFSLENLPGGVFRMSVARDKIAITVGERRSNIWVERN